MPDDDRYGVRSDGWPHRHPEDTGFLGDHPTRQRNSLVPYGGAPLVQVGPEPRPRRATIVCMIAVAAAAAGMLAFVYPAHDNQQPPAVAERRVFPPPPEPSAAVSMLPAAAATTSTAAGPSALKGIGRTTTAPTTRPAPPVVTRPPGSTPAAVDLVVGATVGLGVRDQPGFRVRHRDFVGRVEQITSASSRLDRADARFVVREGLARDGCVSLEAVNHPGYYLRHSNFVMRLDQRDNSWLFDQDATFCTNLTDDRKARTLESVNYPDRAVEVGGDGLLRLGRGEGTAFVVRSTL